MNYTDGIYRWGKKEVERVRNNTSVHLYHSHFRKQILSIALHNKVNCACAKCRCQGQRHVLFSRVTVVVLTAGVKCNINKRGFMLFQYIITLWEYTNFIIEYVRIFISVSSWCTSKCVKLFLNMNNITQPNLYQLSGIHTPLIQLHTSVCVCVYACMYVRMCVHVYSPL